MPRKTDTRERLIDAAIAVIESQGEAGVRVAEMADAVNITKPSIYHFFGDREGLVTAALAEMYRRALVIGRNDLLDVVRTATTPEQLSEAFFAVVSSFWREEGARRRAMRIEVLGAAVSRPDLQSALVDMHRDQEDFLVELFTIGRERGLINLQFDPRSAAQWATGVILSRHIAEIEPAAARAEWDAITREAFRHLLFGGRDGERSGSTGD